MERPPETRPARGITVVGIFLIFASTMATLAGVLLLFPGTSMDRLWGLNPTAHAQLESFPRALGTAFLVLAAVMATAAAGWFRRRYWAWVLTVVIMSTQALGDAVNILRGDYLRGGVGFVIAGALLVYLFLPSVRKAFSTPAPPTRG